METPVTEADRIFFKLVNSESPANLSEQDLLVLNNPNSRPKWIDDRIKSIKEKCFQFMLVKADVLTEIGYFFLGKNNFDKRNAEFELAMIHIHNIFYSEGKLVIVCENPGHLIGPKGQTISDLSICLNSWFKDYFEKNNIPHFEIPIDIKECVVNPYLFSFMEN